MKRPTTEVKVELAKKIQTQLRVYLGASRRVLRRLILTEACRRRISSYFFWRISPRMLVRASSKLVKGLGLIVRKARVEFLIEGPGFELKFAGRCCFSSLNC